MSQAPNSPAFGNLIDERTIPPQTLDPSDPQDDENETNEHDDDPWTGQTHTRHHRSSRFVVYFIDNMETFNGIYALAQGKIKAERRTQPGIVSTIMYAKQLRDLYLLLAQENLKAKGFCHIYAGTVGCFAQNWTPWINSIKYEPDYNLWSDQQTSSPSRDRTPDGLSLSTTVSPPLSVVIQPAITSANENDDGSHEIALIQSLGNLRIHHVKEDELQTLQGVTDINDDPFINDTPSQLEYVPWSSYEVFEQSPALRLHRHTMNTDFSTIHNKLGLSVTFSDLFLNLVNTLCYEFEQMSIISIGIGQLTSPSDSKFLRAYKVLLIHVRSSQPPFKIQDDIQDVPVLHLELFFDALIRDDRIMSEPKIPLRHYSDKEQLNIDRYAALINEAYKVKNELFKTQGIILKTTPTSPSRRNGGSRSN